MARSWYYNFVNTYQYLLILQLKSISIFSRENSNRNNTSKNFEVIKSWTRKEVLKDLKFYSILPAMLASSFIITGIVINQTFIVVSKDWENLQ